MKRPRPVGTGPSPSALIWAHPGISNPLYALVAFRSLFNTPGVLVFMPPVNPLSRRLERAFAKPEPPLTRYLTEADMAIHDIALKNMSRETLRMIDQATALKQLTFGLEPDSTSESLTMALADALPDTEAARDLAAIPVSG